MIAVHSNAHREPHSPSFSNLAPYACSDPYSSSGESMRSFDGEQSQLKLRDGKVRAVDPEMVSATNEASLLARSLLLIAMVPQQFNTEV